MFEILCYGDSNTWGYCALQDTRYQWNVRWTGRLQQLLGVDYHVIENGMCGRTTSFSSKEEPWANAILDIESTIRTNAPLDYCIIMLGTNDVKEEFQKTPVEITISLNSVINACLSDLFWNQELNHKMKIIILSPPYISAIKNSPFASEFGLESELKSKALPRHYEELAINNGWEFIDIAKKVKVDKYDGIHLNEKGHEEVASLIYLKIKELERKALYG